MIGNSDRTTRHLPQFYRSKDEDANESDLVIERHSLYAFLSCRKRKREKSLRRIAACRLHSSPHVYYPQITKKIVFSLSLHMVIIYVDNKYFYMVFRGNEAEDSHASVSLSLSVVSSALPGCFRTK